MIEPYADDAVFDVSAVFTDVAPIRGRQNMVRYWHELRETWEGIRFDPLEVLDAGDGQYVVDMRLWGKGQRSGVEVDQRLGMLYDVGPDGKVNSARLLPSVATAIAAAASSGIRA
jgi:hypothetical protein